MEGVQTDGFQFLFPSPRLKPRDRYNEKQVRVKLCVRWLLSQAFPDQPIPDQLQSSNHATNEALLDELCGGSLYSLACSNIFGGGETRWQPGLACALSALARRGVELARELDRGVLAGETSTSNSALLAEHVILIEGLISAYCAQLVPTDLVLTSVRQFAPVSAQESAPYDTEDALLLWANKVAGAFTRFVANLARQEADWQAKQSTSAWERRRGLEESSDWTSSVGEVAVVDDLYRDISDGKMLAAIISFYCPAAVPPQNVRTKGLMSFSDCVYNLQIVSHFTQTHLPQYPLAIEDILYPTFELRQHVVLAFAQLLRFLVCSKHPVTHSPLFKSQDSIAKEVPEKVLRRKLVENAAWNEDGVNNRFDHESPPPIMPQQENNSRSNTPSQGRNRITSKSHFARREEINNRLSSGLLDDSENPGSPMADLQNRWKRPSTRGNSNDSGAGISDDSDPEMNEVRSLVRSRNGGGGKGSQLSLATVDSALSTLSSGADSGHAPAARPRTLIPVSRSDMNMRGRNSPAPAIPSSSSSDTIKSGVSCGSSRLSRPLSTSASGYNLDEDRSSPVNPRPLGSMKSNLRSSYTILDREDPEDDPDVGDYADPEKLLEPSGSLQAVRSSTPKSARVHNEGYKTYSVKHSQNRAPLKNSVHPINIDDLEPEPKPRPLSAMKHSRSTPRLDQLLDRRSSPENEGYLSSSTHLSRDYRRPASSTHSRETVETTDDEFLVYDRPPSGAIIPRPDSFNSKARTRRWGDSNSSQLKSRLAETHSDSRMRDNQSKSSFADQSRMRAGDWPRSKSTGRAAAHELEISDRGSDTESMSSINSSYSAVRMKMEERKRQIQKEKARLEATRAKQRQRMGKTAFNRVMRANMSDTEQRDKLRDLESENDAAMTDGGEMVRNDRKLTSFNKLNNQYRRPRGEAGIQTSNDYDSFSQRRERARSVVNLDRPERSPLGFPRSESADREVGLLPQGESTLDVRDSLERKMLIDQNQRLAQELEDLKARFQAELEQRKLQQEQQALHQQIQQLQQHATLQHSINTAVQQPAAFWKQPPAVNTTTLPNADLRMMYTHHHQQQQPPPPPPIVPPLQSFNPPYAVQDQELYHNFTTTHQHEYNFNTLNPNFYNPAYNTAANPPHPTQQPIKSSAAAAGVQQPAPVNDAQSPKDPNRTQPHDSPQHNSAENDSPQHNSADVRTPRKRADSRDDVFHTSRPQSRSPSRHLDEDRSDERTPTAGRSPEPVRSTSPQAHPPSHSPPIPTVQSKPPPRDISPTIVQPTRRNQGEAFSITFGGGSDSPAAPSPPLLGASRRSKTPASATRKTPPAKRVAAPKTPKAEDSGGSPQKQEEESLPPSVENGGDATYSRSRADSFRKIDHALDIVRSLGSEGLGDTLPASLEGTGESGLSLVIQVEEQDKDVERKRREFIERRKAKQAAAEAARKRVGVQATERSNDQLRKKQEEKEAKKLEAEQRRERIMAEYQRRKAEKDAIESGRPLPKQSPPPPAANVILTPNTKRKGGKPPRELSRPAPPRSRKNSVQSTDGDVLSVADELDFNKSEYSEYSGPKLYSKPSSKTNKQKIQMAVSQCIFPGAVNAEMKNKLIAELDKVCSSGVVKHFLVLFRDGALKYRGLYTVDLDSGYIAKMHGSGPPVIRDRMIQDLYKYDSGSKRFNMIPAKTLSASVDGFTIQAYLWKKK